MIIHTNNSSPKTKKRTQKQRELEKSWNSLCSKYATSGKPAVKSSTYSIKVPQRGKPAQSVDTGGIATKSESPQYTGDAMLGVAQMHKSNAVPVFTQENAVELAKMRR